MLLAAGADITLCDVDGETALMRACFAMCVDLVDILLRAGSDPNFFNGAPLYIAARASSFDCMKLLIDAGADVKLAPFILASLTVDNNDFRIIKVSYAAILCHWRITLELLRTDKLCFILQYDVTVE